MTNKVLKLNSLVEYQANSIVSREIVNKKNGTVTVFAFGEGQGLSEHTAPYDALVCIVDGEAQITIAGVDYTLSAGELICMPANKPHALKALQKVKMILVMIKS